MKLYLPMVLVALFLGAVQVVTGIPIWGGIQLMYPTFSQFEIWVVLVTLQTVQFLTGVTVAWTVHETLKLRKHKGG